jgi:sec-independent protein translocase protein TatB
MFGIGGSEIIVILIVALLFLGPDKLPEAAKTISKGIRDLKKQSRTLQQTIENDERIGGAIRDIKSALRGEDPPPRPKPIKPIKEIAETSTANGQNGETNGETKSEAPVPAAEETKPALTLSPTAGEAEPTEAPPATVEEVAALVRPAPDTVDRGSVKPEEPKHG